VDTMKLARYLIRACSATRPPRFQSGMTRRPRRTCCIPQVLLHSTMADIAPFELRRAMFGKHKHSALTRHSLESRVRTNSIRSTPIRGVQTRAQRSAESGRSISRKKLIHRQCRVEESGFHGKKVVHETQ
jgi:hypothetical protein